MLNYIRKYISRHSKPPTYSALKIHFPELHDAQIDSMLNNLMNDGQIEICYSLKTMFIEVK